MATAATERVSGEGEGGIAAPHAALTAGPFAHFLARTGHRVLRGAGTYWYDASPGFFLSLPSHRLLEPSADELRALLRHQPCAGVRFPAPLEGPGKLSYQIVCDTRGYGLESLSANARSKVRRGLRRCAVTPVAFSAIAAEGVAADRDTLARQGRAVRLPGPAWERFWAGRDGDRRHGRMGGRTRAAAWRPSWSRCSSTTASSFCSRARAAIAWTPTRTTR